MKLNEMTTEHLGHIATDDDLAEFKAWTRTLMERESLTEEEAIDTLWGDGDYFSNAVRLGLAEV